jgi:hypothetical protein
MGIHVHIHIHIHIHGIFFELIMVEHERSVVVEEEGNKWDVVFLENAQMKSVIKIQWVEG